MDRIKLCACLFAASACNIVQGKNKQHVFSSWFSNLKTNRGEKFWTRVCPFVSGLDSETVIMCWYDAAPSVPSTVLTSYAGQQTNDGKRARSLRSSNRENRQDGKLSPWSNERRKTNNQEKFQPQDRQFHLDMETLQIEEIEPKLCSHIIYNDERIRDFLRGKSPVAETKILVKGIHISPFYQNRPADELCGTPCFWCPFS